MHGITDFVYWAEVVDEFSNEDGPCWIVNVASRGVCVSSDPGVSPLRCFFLSQIGKGEGYLLFIRLENVLVYAEIQQSHLMEMFKFISTAIERSW